MTEVVATEEGWVARVDRFWNRRLRCGHCGGETRMTRGRRRERRWKDLSLRDKAFWIVYRPFRVFCPRCGLRVEKVPWARRWERVTQALAQAIALLGKKLSLKEVADDCGLGWKVVATVVKRVVEEGLKLRKVKTLHILGKKFGVSPGIHEFILLTHSNRRLSQVREIALMIPPPSSTI